MSVTPEMIAVALGVTAPGPGSTQAQQWAMWVEDANMLIEARRLAVDAALVIDQAKLDYVVREAVVAQAKHPDDATQVSVSVDDASTQRTYRSGSGRVSIRDEWWTLLGLAPQGGRAYSIDTVGRGTSGHLPWCDLLMGGADCSCGASLTRYEYPLYEGGVLSPQPDWWNWS